MIFYSSFIAPFSDFAFMRRALIACFALSLSSGPVGVFLILRRMSLMGDVLSHAILPGAAMGFLLVGFSLWAMSVGGLIMGLVVALSAGLVSRATNLYEDASFAGFYLMSLALGVLILSKTGSAIDLLHLLFGNILAVDQSGLFLVTSLASITIICLALIYRPLILECFDPIFLAVNGGKGLSYHMIFLVLVVLNLIAGFQALGTLMAVGLMIVPAAAARLWSMRVWQLCGLAIIFGFGASILGLLISFHFDLPSGPAIILVAGVIYLISIIAGSQGGVLKRYFPKPHYHEREPGVSL